MLDKLVKSEGARKRKKRVGRGDSSGWGVTAGRGNKGLGARSGGGRKLGYEGGQMPLHRRLPKRGFHNPFRIELVPVNQKQLTGFEKDSVVDVQTLKIRGIVKQTKDGIAILGTGDISIPITVKANKFSRSAREKILAAGGKVEVV